MRTWTVGGGGALSDIMDCGAPLDALSYVSACSHAPWILTGGTSRKPSLDQRNCPGPTPAVQVKGGAFQNLRAACEALDADKRVGQNEKRRSRSGYCSVMDLVG